MLRLLGHACAQRALEDLHIATRPIQCTCSSPRQLHRVRGSSDSVLRSMRTVTCAASGRGARSGRSGNSANNSNSNSNGGDTTRETISLDVGGQIEQLSVSLQDPSNELLKFDLRFPLGIAFEAQERGVVVAEVAAGGAAGSAGAVHACFKVARLHIRWFVSGRRWIVCASAPACVQGSSETS